MRLIQREGALMSKLVILNTEKFFKKAVNVSLEIHIDSCC